MNWGNRIVLAFICFAAFIGYMVVRAFQEDFDLVAEDYYAQEINYQQKLKQLFNSASLEEQVSVKQGVNEIQFTFPKTAEGEIYFYHPSRELFDKKFDIKTTSEGLQSISKEDLVPGNYRINISWTNDKKEYFQQSKIFIQ